MKTADLLKVLDLGSQEAQIKALYRLGYEYFVFRKCGRDGGKYECREGSLADLAFRLRDKVYKDSNIQLHDAMYLIQQKEGGEDLATAFWGLYSARPIDWIIAALIALKGKD